MISGLLDNQDTETLMDYWSNLLYDYPRRCCTGICYGSIIIDTLKAKLKTFGACSMLRPVVLEYSGSVRQSLYTQTIEPGPAWTMKRLGE